jgi:hypothetical protein
MTTTDIAKLAKTLKEIGVPFKDTRNGPWKDGLFVWETGDDGSDCIVLDELPGYTGYYSVLAFDGTGKFNLEESGTWE